VFWYRELALGGIAGVGPLQLAQPFFGFVLAALLLHEQVHPTMTVAAHRHRTSPRVTERPRVGPIGTQHQHCRRLLTSMA